MCTGYVWLSFLHASGQMYPASVFMVVVFILFMTQYGKGCYWCATLLSKLFLCLILLSTLSFANYAYGTRYEGGLFFKYSLFHIFCFSLVWYVLYMFGLTYARRVKSQDVIMLFAVLFFICGVWNNFRAYNYFRILNDNMMQHHYYYFVLQCIPLLLLTFRGGVKYICLGVLLICTILAFKRTGFTISIGLFLVNLIIDSKVRLKRILAYGILASAVVYVSYSYLGQDESFTYLMERFANIKEDRGSGRETNFMEILKEVDNSSVEEKILGHGFMAMLANHHRMVDVEVASMLYSFGYVGLFLYGMFHLLMIRRIIYISKHRDEAVRGLLPSYVSCYLVFLVYAFAGEVFTYHYLFGLLFLYLGYAEGKLSLYKR